MPQRKKRNRRNKKSKKKKRAGVVKNNSTTEKVESMLSVFKRVTEERNDVVANFFLESGGWDLETAVRLWSEQDESEVAMQQSLFKEEEVEEKEEEETPTQKVPTQEAPTQEVRTAPPPPTPTPTKVRCCLCGVLTDPNESNKCLACLAPDIDLRSELMSKQDGVPTIIQCRECRKYQITKRFMCIVIGNP